ncbi:Transcription factor fungi [Macrophomina phaseolina MS6]|uniref:Transcription factor fungi n=1 Tax=Macrophomina phaseolina (strain MS6) TaxID=1126212 RepID=K2RU33_MACPH|nr:Transcription factor fungi [Macrophomina phaseolina MS6]
MIKCDRVEEKADKDIIQPLTTTSLPPQTPESSVGLEHQDQVYLPPQEHASAYSQRYFDEVHCLYWLFSTEQFHERVHETYVTGGVIASASWLCCLYSIFAIGSAGADIPGQKRSTEFLVMAKALVPQVNDEADVDSIRALCLLALALQVECHTNAAYLYIGTAVRTAYSLGLHVEKAPPSRGRLEREQNRRIWWTLYLLDYEIAHRYGNPCAVLDGTHPNQVQMPSEQILGPGPNTPPGYLAAASSLCRLSRRIRANLHNPTPTSSPTSSSAAVPPTTPTVSLATIQSLLSSMQDWLSSLPPHLSALAHTAPSHRRAVGILHLNYWAHVVLITRPFLLYTVLHHWEQQHSSSGTATATAALTGDKKRHFDQLGATCVSAAEQALGIMRTMSQQRTLSSIVNFDCSCLLEMVQIFRLALAMEKATEGGAAEGKRAMAQIVESLGILRGMEFVGWTSQALPELEVQLRDCAIFNADEDDPFALGREAAATGGVNTERMEVEDTLGAFFGDVLGEGSAAGGAFGDNYNNLLFLEIDFT